MVILVELLERPLLRPYLNSVDKLNLKIQPASVHIQIFPMDDQHQPQHHQHRHRRREHHQEHRQKQHRLVERRRHPCRGRKDAKKFAENLRTRCAVIESENEKIYQK